MTLSFSLANATVCVEVAVLGCGSLKMKRDMFHPEVGT
jgi:hypothetical protein